MKVLVELKSVDIAFLMEISDRSPVDLENEIQDTLENFCESLAVSRPENEIQLGMAIATDESIAKVTSLE